MITVMRRNKQLRIDEARLNDFLKMGYAEVDEKTGKPVAVEEDAKSDTSLKKENTSLKKANKELTEQVTALTAKVEELEKAKAELAKEEKE